MHSYEIGRTLVLISYELTSMYTNFTVVRPLICPNTWGTPRAMHPCMHHGYSQRVHMCGGVALCRVCGFVCVCVWVYGCVCMWVDV